MPVVNPEEKTVWLTNSFRSTFDSCRYKAYLSNVHGGYGIKTAVPAAPLRIGTAIHKGLECLYRGMSEEMSTYIALQTYKRIIDNAPIDVPSSTLLKMDKEQAVVKAYLKTYIDTYIDDFMQYDVLDTEQTLMLSYPLYGFKDWFVRYSGVIDLILRTKIAFAEYLINLRTRRTADQTLMIIDHKTMSMWKDAFYDKAFFDYQMTGYAELVFVNHLEYFGNPPIPFSIVYNCIRKSLLRQKKNESEKEFLERVSGDYAARPTEYFKRIDCHRTLEQRSDWYDAVQGVAGDVLRCYDSGSWRKNMAVCDLYSGCPFRSICVTGNADDINFVKKSVAHEELGDNQEVGIWE